MPTVFTNRPEEKMSWFGTLVDSFFAILKGTLAMLRGKYTAHDQ